MIARKETSVFSAGSKTRRSQRKTCYVFVSSDNDWTLFYGYSSLQNLSGGIWTKGVRIPLTRADYVGLGQI